MRDILIAGNWKMNKTTAEALAFAEEVKGIEAGDNVDLAILAPFTQIGALKDAFEDSDILVGAQNVHQMPSGAYTGEISADMLDELDIHYCIVGHSERREYFKETDADVNAKLKALLAKGITPILCVGEPLNVRGMGGHLTHVGVQVHLDLAGIPITDIKNIVIAYEPIWAIGTGKTATPEEADMMCGFIRGIIEGLYDDVSAERIQILYGGSMKPENAAELLAKENIDGGLIGGASLKADSFIELARIAAESVK
ncbi:MAG: triose-phosphate isomerase [Clostridiales bacterium]|nr:triose-phosphate isomerase [Candidatus Crickella merdequi]